MSYEGYDIYYCENGHQVKMVSEPGPGPDFDKCPYCGVTRFVIDSVDLTNCCIENCDTNNPDNPCPAHPRPLKIKEYFGRSCPVCEGIGLVRPIRFNMVSCICKGKDKACKKCFGTAEEYILEKDFLLPHSIPCIACRSRGKEYIPIYDLAPLLLNGQEPREIDIYPFDSRMAEDHINHKVD